MLEVYWWKRCAPHFGVEIGRAISKVGLDSLEEKFVGCRISFLLWFEGLGIAAENCEEEVESRERGVETYLISRLQNIACACRS